MLLMVALLVAVAVVAMVIMVFALILIAIVERPKEALEGPVGDPTTLLTRRCVREGLGSLLENWINWSSGCRAAE